MAHIRARRRADGSYGYTAHIRIFDKKRLIHEEAKTFSRRLAAEKWAKAREVELENPEALLRAQEGELLLCNLIRWYIDEFRNVSNWGRGKQKSLEVNGTKLNGTKLSP